MAEIDDELVARAIRWCAEAGRQAGAAAVRAALAPLSWDQLLAARALLADPPPARPLGPQALADMARGAPADAAAERERGGRYRAEPEAPLAVSAPAPPTARRPAGRKGRAPAPVVIRRARDRAPETPAVLPRLPSLVQLLAPEGRAVLEGLIRRLGARAAVLVAELARGWALAGGGAPGEQELRALLDHHGLARGFARRERTAALHAVRAAGGVKSRAAPELGLDAAGLDRLLEQTGAAAEAEAVREERRRDVRRRATLAERARLLLGDEERLRDLGVLEELEQDLRARLPDHLRALRAAGRDPLPAALARSLSLGPDEVRGLARRLGLDLSSAAPAAPRPSPAARPAARLAASSAVRPAPRPGSRPVARPAASSAARPAPRPAPRPGARAADRQRPARPSRRAARPDRR